AVAADRRLRAGDEPDGEDHRRDRTRAAVPVDAGSGCGRRWKARHRARLARPVRHALADPAVDHPRRQPRLSSGQYRDGRGGRSGRGLGHPARCGGVRALGRAGLPRRRGVLRIARGRAETTMKQAYVAILATVLITGALARAQPAPVEPRPGGTNPAPAGSGTPPTTPPLPGGSPNAPADPYAPAKPSRPAPPPRPPIDFPEVLNTPTGWLLPAAVLYSKNALDTGGGITSDTRVGLGDVAEFGVATTDQVRERTLAGDKPERIQPYVTASFRLGVSENRLFDNQPGMTLGFRKSFERNHSGFKSRI